jgi:hypothetical protein
MPIPPLAAAAAAAAIAIGVPGCGAPATICTEPGGKFGKLGMPCTIAPAGIGTAPGGRPAGICIVPGGGGTIWPCTTCAPTAGTPATARGAKHSAVNVAGVLIVGLMQNVAGGCSYQESL